ncbi:hypothetical protein AO393_10440 [Pseudomonas syringae pv. syringae]|nr:hypothetical protein AL063_16475 [Pseudomonas syringae pv. syringae]PHN23081.1 hypothetical protein AO256_25340 [Pseudomonas syringae]KWS25597.1 hypothetical protein AL061_17675 [Pseudomonas syringae pv. syringae]PHX32518.1 hypothetical protein AO278_25000 [Pseudomonas syringae pv. syringae]PHX49155.1 hypothetical protein AO393_10440 [Pseudomonas syringae pv. syringae]
MLSTDKKRPYSTLRDESGFLEFSYPLYAVKHLIFRCILQTRQIAFAKFCRVKLRLDEPSMCGAIYAEQRKIRFDRLNNQDDDR